MKFEIGNRVSICSFKKTKTTVFYPENVLSKKILVSLFDKEMAS